MSCNYQLFGWIKNEKGLNKKTKSRHLFTGLEQNVRNLQNSLITHSSSQSALQPAKQLNNSAALVSGKEVRSPNLTYRRRRIKLIWGWLEGWQYMHTYIRAQFGKLPFPGFVQQLKAINFWLLLVGHH